MRARECCGVVTPHIVSTDSPYLEGNCLIGGVQNDRPIKAVQVENSRGEGFSTFFILMITIVATKE